MTIEYKNYEIEVGENSFDLYQNRPPKQVSRAKGDEVRCILGYFSKLPSAIQKIIQVEMYTREEKVALSKFLEVYKSLKEEVENSVNLPK